MRTTGNTVLITGGGAGIGLALARRFHAAGNHVIITGRDQGRLAAAQAELAGVDAAIADMRDAAALDALADRYPAANILINNAGVQHLYELAAPSAPELAGAELATNLLGPARLITRMLPRLLAHPAAAIVNVTSGLALVPKQSAPMYCASKAALRSLTKSLRWQLAGSSVKVFELLPPLVDTAMTQGRGSGKISPAAVADAFWRAFGRDRLEIPVGKTRLLMAVQRLAPALADRIMRRS